jgi:hypothetical protein
MLVSMRAWLASNVAQSIKPGWCSRRSTDHSAIGRRRVRLRSDPCSTVRCLGGFAPGSAPRAISGIPETSGHEIAAADSLDRSDPRGFVDRSDAPALFALEGANIGFQLGGQATDFVLLVMNNKGANSILSSKVKLGADASAAAGPKGRTAAADTDIVMRAEVLSYSRSRGLFAGISLEGSTLRSDGSANRKLYGRSLSAKEIVRQGKVGVPASGRKLISLLNKQSPKNESDPVSLKE